MYLDNRQKQIVTNSLKDYDFIKNEIESKLNLQNCELEDISRFLGKFDYKELEITNLEKYKDYAYLDFIYKDLNMCVMWERFKGNRVSPTFEIYDKERQSYIVEDFLTKEEYKEILNTKREDNLEDLVGTLKWYEARNMKNAYENQIEVLINFLKENW